MDKKIYIGHVCSSKAGRDKYRYFIIYSIERGGYVRLVDGQTRKLENPKRKNIKHINIQNEILGEIGEKIARGAYLQNAEIKKALAVFKETALRNKER